MKLEDFAAAKIMASKDFFQARLTMLSSTMARDAGREEITTMDVSLALALMLSNDECKVWSQR